MRTIDAESAVLAGERETPLENASILHNIFALLYSLQKARTRRLTNLILAPTLTIRTHNFAMTVPRVPNRDHSQGRSGGGCALRDGRDDSQPPLSALPPPDREVFEVCVCACVVCASVCLRVRACVCARVRGHLSASHVSVSVCVFSLFSFAGVSWAYLCMRVPAPAQRKVFMHTHTHTTMCARTLHTQECLPLLPGRSAGERCGRDFAGPQH